MKDNATGTRLPSAQQQQPRRPMDRQQQQSSGSGEFQPRRAMQAGAPKEGGGKDKQMGEGSYEGTRDYQDSVETYLKKGQLQSDAKAAKPRTPEEEAALKKAEQEGLSHSKAPGQ